MQWREAMNGRTASILECSLEEVACIRAGRNEPGAVGHSPISGAGRRGQSGGGLPEGLKDHWSPVNIHYVPLQGEEQEGEGEETDPKKSTFYLTGDRATRKSHGGAQDFEKNLRKKNRKLGLRKVSGRWQNVPPQSLTVGAEDVLPQNMPLLPIDHSELWVLEKQQIRGKLSLNSCICLKTDPLRGTQLSLIPSQEFHQPGRTDSSQESRRQVDTTPRQALLQTLLPPTYPSKAIHLS